MNKVTQELTVLSTAVNELINKVEDPVDQAELMEQLDQIQQHRNTLLSSSGELDEATVDTTAENLNTVNSAVGESLKNQEHIKETITKVAEGLKNVSQLTAQLS